MGLLSSSGDLAVWRLACAAPRCGNRCFRSGQRKAIIRTLHRLEMGSDYMGLVPVTGLEPVRCRQRWILSPLRLPIPSHRQTALFQDSFYIIAKDRKFCKHNFWAVCRLPSAGVNPAPADGPAPVTWNTQTPSPAEGWGPCAERSAPGGGGRSDSTRCRPDRRSWSAPPASCGR